MECLTDIKLNEYIEGSLTAVEKSIVRDHLILCQSCNQRYETYMNLEKTLMDPVFITPPDIITKSVMKQLFPFVPGYTSIFAFIAASFLLLVTSIYVYFDFSNNSIVQAFELTSDSTSNWLGAILKTISTIFTSIYAVFKAFNRFLEIVFKVNIGVEIIGLSIMLMMILTYYSLSHLVFKKVKGNT
ncbi:MAG: hypothetical protein GY757_61275 [bacterium]|nr:hypothetical protein [bacterium]